MKIVIIGSGNVATHLGLALKSTSHRILQVYSRGERTAKALSRKLSCSFVTDVKKISDEADLYIVALRDDAIAEFLKKFPATDKVILHTSGSVSLNIFRKKFKNCGVLYPVQTFSIGHMVNLKSTPFCLEASNASTRRKMVLLAKTMTKKMFFINSEKRKSVHLSAVFANNFTNHLFVIAENILRHENISFDLLKPIILETAMKVQKYSPLETQTGPAKRNDTATMKEHLKMLEGRKELKEIYRLISESISEMSGIRL